MEVGFKNNNTEKLRSGWKMIQKNIAHTSELVTDLLNYSKVREPEYSTCRPNDIVGEVCQSMNQTALENNIRIITDLDPAIGEVSMDGGSLYTVLMNLVSNAIDACIFDDSPGKSLAVTVKTILESGLIIRFEVRDNGSGMPPDVKEKIFLSFFSTKGHRGTGLGLLISGKLIEDHGGSIKVFSEVGKGTTFTVKLPFRKPGHGGK